jgi:two-component system response regulator FixJ
MADRSSVFVVDDDPDVRDSLQVLLHSHGYHVELFKSATGFLAAVGPDRHGCLVADVRMPEMDGLELQQELVKRNSRLAVIVMTGHGDVPLAVRAMKAGAIDFLEKPFEEGSLLDSISLGLKLERTTADQHQAVELARERMANLTERERQVMELLITGKANKIIAFDLSISVRTVEVHRARVMEKMSVRGLAELVRIALGVSSGQPN